MSREVISNRPHGIRLVNMSMELERIIVYVVSKPQTFSLLP